MNSEDGKVYSVCILHFSCFTKHNRMQSKHKQTNKVYSFLSRHPYTKSKNYLKRRYRIGHWIPMFIGTPCTSYSSYFPENQGRKLTCISLWILNSNKKGSSELISTGISSKLNRKEIKFQYICKHVVSKSQCFLLFSFSWLSEV